MCGRYYRKSDKQKIAESFHVTHVDDFPLPPADYNVSPTTMQPIVRNNRDTGERELVSLRWGLIPFFYERFILGQRYLHNQCSRRDRHHIPHLPRAIQETTLHCSGLWVLRVEKAGRE